MSEKLQKAREYETREAQLIHEDDRPCFHFTPRIGWMNDPNGFSFYKGQYHLFYQYYPYDTKWNAMHWGHAVSDDLLHWTYLPCALAPDQVYDGFGCFSGSAIELKDGRHLLLYTGVEERTHANGIREELQTQCIAIGDGVNYEKLPQNPVVDGSTLPEGSNPHDFRDPKIWREEDGSYAFVVGSRHADGSGQLLVYRSPDAMSWKLDTVLDRCHNAYGTMWECPDTFRLDGKDVILTSPMEMDAEGLEFHNGHGTLCIIGHYHPETKRMEREFVQAVEYGLDFYAMQTMQAPDGRRIMIAWLQNWGTNTQPPASQRWQGQMTLPRELSIRNGKLIQVPIRELEALRRDRVTQQRVISGETTLPGVQGRVIDLMVQVRPVQEGSYQRFFMKVCKDERHYTEITYDPLTNVLSLDRTHSGCRRDIVHERKCLARDRQGELKLRVVLDRFSVEVFVNDGEQALTAAIDTSQAAQDITFACLGQAQVDVEKYDLVMLEKEKFHD